MAPAMAEKAKPTVLAIAAATKMMAEITSHAGGFIRARARPGPSSSIHPPPASGTAATPHATAREAATSGRERVGIDTSMAFSRAGGSQRRGVDPLLLLRQSEAAGAAGRVRRCRAPA